MTDPPVVNPDDLSKLGSNEDFYPEPEPLAYPTPPPGIKKRQNLRDGSFLDVDVYRKAFHCEVPYQDPCIVNDCFEGGVVYDDNGNVAPSGSADQSGLNGEDTGDDGGGDGDDGGQPTANPTTTTPQTTPAPTYIDCTSQNADPGLGITSGYCVCDSSTFAQNPKSQSPYNSCAYTVKPTETIPNPQAFSTGKPKPSIKYWGWWDENYYKLDCT